MLKPKKLRKQLRDVKRSNICPYRNHSRFIHPPHGVVPSWCGAENCLCRKFFKREEIIADIKQKRQKLYQNISMER